MCFFGFGFLCVVFFFKQKTAYEMRISDWSSDVCSSDLPAFALVGRQARRIDQPLQCGGVGTMRMSQGPVFAQADGISCTLDQLQRIPGTAAAGRQHAVDRKSTRLNSSH